MVMNRHGHAYIVLHNPLEEGSSVNICYGGAQAQDGAQNPETGTQEHRLADHRTPGQHTEPGQAGTGSLLSVQVRNWGRNGLT